MKRHYDSEPQGFIESKRDESNSLSQVNFPMPHLLNQVDNVQGATIKSLLNAMVLDFGELAFKENKETQIDLNTREVIAAGWRNLWNISKIIDSRMIERDKRLSCYTMNDDSQSEKDINSDEGLPFYEASDEDESELLAKSKAVRYEKYRKQ